MRFFNFFAATFLFISGFQMNSQTNPVETTYLEGASIEVLDDELNKVLQPENKLEILSQGHDWTEGPLWLEKQQKLIFSDIPRNTVYSWDQTNGTQEYLNPSGFTGEKYEGAEPGANGLLLDPKGHLVLCQHGNRQMARMISSLDEPEPEYASVVQTYEGKRFNSPNDATYDRKGNLYFTDPPYGLAQQMDDPEKELDFQGVFRLDKNDELTLIDKALSRPNGIALSPDESVLYVANSDPDKAIWMAYQLSGSGKVQSKKLFFDATGSVPNEKGLPDGLKVNKKGYLFATGPGGVWIFNPSGKHLGTIRTGQATSNVAFNSDQSVLYMTADDYLLKLDLRGAP